MDRLEQEKYIKETRERFRSYTDEELVASFNGQLGNSGWTWTRSVYLWAMHQEFIRRGWDYSVVSNDGKGLRLAHGNDVYLFNNKLCLLRKAKMKNTLKSIAMSKIETEEILEIETVTLIDEKAKNKLQAKAEKESQVIVHCNYFALSGDSKIRIWKPTFLYAKGSDHKSKLVYVENISMYPEWTTIKSGGTLNFTLIFTGLPKDCVLFDLIENIPERGGFVFRNIERNDTDVYQVDFS